jgi:hypothetical protein
VSARLSRRLRIFRRRIVIGEFARATGFSIEMTDLGVDALEDRISAIEEIIAARWPRSTVLRRRLARKLRASDATFRWAGSTFAVRRAEAMSEDIAVRTLPKAARGEIAAGRPYRRPR